MPNPISSSAPALQTATYSKVPPADPPQETTPPQDIIDISVTGDSDGEPTQPVIKSYGPSTIRDQFKFDIENGRFGTRGRYTPLHTNFEQVASTTYESRSEIGTKITAQLGQQSAQSALFALGYQDSSPDSEKASTHVDARAEQNRRIDRGLDLLSML